MKLSTNISNINKKFIQKQKLENDDNNKYTRIRQLQSNNLYFTLGDEENKKNIFFEDPPEEEEKLFEVYSKTDLITNKQLRGNCFLQHNGFFYDLSLIKWSKSKKYIYFL